MTHNVSAVRVHEIAGCLCLVTWPLFFFSVHTTFTRHEKNIVALFHRIYVFFVFFCFEEVTKVARFHTRFGNASSCARNGRDASPEVCCRKPTCVLLSASLFCVRGERERDREKASSAGIVAALTSARVRQLVPRRCT